MTGAEKRKHPRVMAACAMDYRSVFNTEPYPTVTRDIGGAGLRFFTCRPLDPGTVLKIDLQLPEREAPLRLQAEVLRYRTLNPVPREACALGYEAAVFFTNISEMDKTVLQRHMAAKGGKA